MNVIMQQYLDSYRSLESQGVVSKLEFVVTETPEVYLDMGGGEYLVVPPKSSIDLYFCVPPVPKYIEFKSVITREGFKDVVIS